MTALRDELVMERAVGGAPHFPAGHCTEIMDAGREIAWWEGPECSCGRHELKEPLRYPCGGAEWAAGTPERPPN